MVFLWKNLTVGRILFVLQRRNTLVAAEHFYKIAYIIKATGQGNICNRIIGFCQLDTGSFDAVAVEVINRILLGYFFEETAEIVGGQTGSVS